MRIRIILAPHDGSRAADDAMATAFLVGRDQGAHVRVLHVSPDPKAAVPLLGEGMPGMMIEDMIATAEKESKARAERTRAQFDGFCERYAVPVTDGPTGGEVSASWRQETGREDEMVVRLGRVSDLLVVPAPATDSEPTAGMTLNAALFECARPVLVAPPLVPASVGRRVAVAWNGSAEAARAVHAAFALLETAEAVSVLTAETEETAAAAAADLVSYLAGHGIAATTRAVDSGEGSVGRALLDACTAIDADLLVTGAYTHSRMRELILGGVTRDLLDGATVALLMAH